MRRVRTWLVAAGILAVVGVWLYSASRPPLTGERKASPLVAAPAMPRAQGKRARVRASAAASSAPPSAPTDGSGQGAPRSKALSVMTVSGSVVDALGGPVIGARVQARVSAIEPVLADALSDERGTFGLEVPAGDYLIEGTAEAYSRAVVGVRAPVQDVVLVLVPESALAGRVITEKSVPVSGVTVSVFNAAGLRAPPMLATSDAQGFFAVRGLAAGGYSLTATSDRFRGGPLWVNVGVAEQAEGLELVVSSATTLSVRATVEGKPCREGQLLLATTPRAFARFDPLGVATLSGIPAGRYALTALCRGAVARTEPLVVGAQPIQLDWELDGGLSVRGVVLSATGNAVEGVDVRVMEVAERRARRLAPRAIHRCTSNAEGEFECRGLTPGAYRVYAEGLREPRSEPVELELPQVSEPLRLQLKPAGSIRAFFRNAESRSQKWSGPGKRKEPGSINRAEPAARGPSQLRGPRQRALFRIRSKQAELARLRAYVRGADGWPFEGRLEGEDTWFRGLPLGTYEVFVGQPSPSSVQQIELTADGELAQVQLQVPSPQLISGTVRDELGVPVVEAWVRVLTSPRVMRVTTQAAQPVLTDELGAFTVQVPTPGEYDVVCTSGAGEGRARQVQAGQQDVSVAFATYGSLSGSVKAPNGSTPPAFEVEYTRQGGPPGRVSGAGGRWSVAWLAPGKYALHLRSDAGEARASAVVPPGGNVLVHSRLEPSRQ